MIDHNISSLQKAEKVITINFPITDVKSAVMVIFSKLPGKYMLRGGDINEVFNTYQFPISNYLNPAIANLSLQEADNNKTTITLIITNSVGALSSNSILESMANEYLHVLGRVLTNEDIEPVEKKMEHGKLILTLLIILALILLIFIIL